MNRSALLLGIAHEFQGPRFLGYIEDPSYRLLVKQAMRGVDVVFEEASGLGPSIAEDLANSVLGIGHYVDIDPSASERAQYGIPDSAMGDGAIDRYSSSDRYEPIRFEALKLREEIWMERMEQRTFKTSTVIVGIAHSVSVAVRLVSAGIAVEEIRGYTPYGKLCRRAHEKPR